MSKQQTICIECLTSLDSEKNVRLNCNEEKEILCNDCYNHYESMGVSS